MTNIKPTTWRDLIKVHPAADLFPLMTAEELKDLGEDIKKNGQRVPVIYWQAEKGAPWSLLDGRSRLDAMEAVGLLVDQDGNWRDQKIRYYLECGGDPYALVLSANIHRRHLTTAQRIELVEKVLKANPAMSSRRAAKLAGVSPSTGVKARHKLEAKGDVSTVDTSIDTKGRKQPTRKPARKRHNIDDTAEKTAKTTTIAADAPGLAPQQTDPDHLISQFTAQVRASGLDVARQIEAACRPMLIERLREMIDEIEIEADRWAKETVQPEEGIPEFLRRT